MWWSVYYDVVDLVMIELDYGGLIHEETFYQVMDYGYVFST